MIQPTNSTRRALRVMLLACGAALGLAAALAPAAFQRRAALESQIRARILAEATRRGLVAQVDGVRVGLGPPLLITGLRVTRPGKWSVAADTAALTMQLRGHGLLGRTRLALGPVRAAGPGGLSADLVPTVWELAGDDAAHSLELREPAPGLTLTSRRGGAGPALEVRATRAPFGSLLTLRRDGAPMLEAGVVDGRLGLGSSPESTTFDVDLEAHGARMAPLDRASGDSAEPLGPPSELRLRFAGSWHGVDGRLDLPRWKVAVDGLSLSGSLSLVDLPRDPRLTLAFEAERVDLARLLVLSAPSSPSAVAAPLGGGPAEESLGSASLSARVTGTLSDPASFVVEQRLDFSPPKRFPPEIERLRRDFVQEVTLPDGGRRALDVSPSSPDFVPLREVPPLLVRTLLLGEDAGFFGHHGIDLAEVPSAILTDWSRGTAARGASTITQQLAKNLFLSREKRLGRKLQEVALALLLESALGKERILEIYLNVIEWGPGVYGLRPAAQRYFNEDPTELTPAQMALLVALVPGPVKYQRSLASGTPSPGFRPLVDRLLAKLRSVDAISEEEYQTALADDLRVAAPGGDGE
jgi:transglycosylase-like protein